MAGEVRVLASLQHAGQRFSPLGMPVALGHRSENVWKTLGFSERRWKICCVFLKDVWKDMRKTLYFLERRSIFHRRVLIPTFY